MDKGTRVYKAYVSAASNSSAWWLDEGTVTEITLDGVPLVRMDSGVLIPLDQRWHTSKAAAKNDALRVLIGRVGEMQAKVDELRDEIMHDCLTTEEVA